MSKSMLFLFTETPLHAGTGRAMGTVDLPIQRERATGYPMIQASGIKGRLRAYYKDVMTNEDLFTVFGPNTDEAAKHAGALSFGDARLLLFPVRSLSGVFAWVTSVDALARFYREAVAVGQIPTWKVPEKEPTNDEIWVGDDKELGIKVGDESRIVLEEYSFKSVKSDVDVKAIGEWLAVNALPKKPSEEEAKKGAVDEYEYWRKALSQKLCILPQDAFRDFTLYATEVQTHIKLNPDKKTVENGMLWTAESLPVDTLLYVPLIAQISRQGNKLSAENVLKKITAPASNKITRINFGGDETTGQGFVAVRFLGGDK
jgi:CRISPR-associated protein Cmr4